MNNSRAPAATRNQIIALIDRAGRKSWSARIGRLRDEAAASPRYGRLVALRHAAEFAAEKVVRDLPLTPVDQVLAGRVASLGSLAAGLGKPGQERFEAALAAALATDGTLIPLLHVHDTAERHRAVGFDVEFAGLEEGATFDLLATREDTAVEIVCDTLSAEAGRLVHRAAWVQLMDRIDPDLQTWLSAHPGRYLLKMTLPRGLRVAEPDDTTTLAELHRRINEMLTSARRSDQDEAAVLRLDPLMLAAAQASENGLMNRLRREFGPEANLAVTGDGQGVFVLAARAGSENEVAVAMRHRLAALAPARLTGTRPGILAMFIEDTDRLEWRLLREQLTLEGEARQFLTFPEARPVVAVTCTSRIELCAEDGADALRFRNPTHPAGKLPALAPAVLSVC